MLVEEAGLPLESRRCAEIAGIQACDVRVALRQQPCKPEIQSRNGNAYMVPVFWGYDSPLFRTDKIPVDDPATKSWGILFDDRFAGHTALRDDAYQALLVAALALGHKDPPTMPLSDLREVQKFLISKKRNIRALWSKFGEAVNLMSSGEVWTMHREG